MSERAHIAAHPAAIPVARWAGPSRRMEAERACRAASLRPLHSPPPPPPRPGIGEGHEAEAFADDELAVEVGAEVPNSHLPAETDALQD